MLNQAKTLYDCQLHSRDGEIGKVKGFYFDDRFWTIRYLVAGTRNWRPEKKVLISPQWVDRVSWGDSKISLNLSREVIKQSPEYPEASILNRDDETGLHRDYKRPGYWVVERVAK